MFTPKKQKEPKEMCNELIDRIIKSPTAALFQELKTFNPEFSLLISERLKPTIFSILNEKNKLGELQDRTMSFIHHMIKKAPEKALIIGFWLSEEGDKNNNATEMLTRLFKHTKTFNSKVIRLLNDFLAGAPITIVNFLTVNKKVLNPMIQMVVSTKEVTSARLLQQLVVSQPAITKAYQSTIKSVLKKFPVGTAIDFMLGIPELQSVIPDNEFKKWLLSHETFTISDIEIVSIFHKEIWEQETSAQVLIATQPSQKISEVDWIHQRPPQQFQISKVRMDDCVHSFLAAERYNGDCSVDAYLYIRLFVFSLGNPTDITDGKVFIQIFDLMSHPCDYVSAAAVQTVIIWILTKNYQTDPSLVFRLSAIAVEDGRPEKLKYLFNAFLHVLATQHEVAPAILNAEPSMQFKEEYINRLKSCPWVFPHFSVLIDFILKIPIMDYTETIKLFGFMSEYVDMDDPKKIKEQITNQNLETV